MDYPLIDAREIMMATRLGEMITRAFSQLRIEPTAKRIRASLGGEQIVDSQRAFLVWEPRRVVPSYAVPRSDIRGVIDEQPEKREPPPANCEQIQVWDPCIPFSVRETGGREVTVAPLASDGRASGFVADDPDLADYVILDFAGFDDWREDDDPIINHPHDSFSRIDIRNTLRVIRISLNGEILAETGHGRILYETGLPMRFYVRREDVRAKLTPSETVTECAYKGIAQYYSPIVADVPIKDLAWSYRQPLIDAQEARDYIAFFDERVDVTIGAIARVRPQTPWS